MPSDATTDLTIAQPEVALATDARLPADRNPYLVYLGSLSRGGVRAMAQVLGVVASLIAGNGVDPERFAWWHLRYPHMERIRTILAERYAPATANRALTATRQVLLRCRRLGLMTGDDYTAAIDVKSVRGTRLPAGRALEPSEIQALCTACGEDRTIALRDFAITMLLARGGLRREEAVLLDLESYEATRAVLIVLGKNNKQRELPVGASLTAALDAWIVVRGPHPGPLFHPLTRTGRVLYRRLSHQSVYGVLAKLAERAGVVDVSPHDFRRTFISELLDRGADLSTVSQLAGHEQVETTKRYDRRGERTKRRAVDLLEDLDVPLKAS